MIPNPSLDLLLWATGTRGDIGLREYTGQQIEGFMQADQLDQEAQEIAKRFTESIRRKLDQRLGKAARLNQSL